MMVTLSVGFKIISKVTRTRCAVTGAPVVAAKGGGFMQTYWICPDENDDAEVMVSQ
jgi:hypothetical protein